MEIQFHDLTGRSLLARGLRLLLVLALLLLAGCGRAAPQMAESPLRPQAEEGDSGAGESVDSGSWPQRTMSPQELELSLDTVVIGIAQEPDSLYRLVSPMAVARIIEYAIREPWILSLDYTYSANPRFLQGELPTIDNGGAVFNGSGAEQRLVVTWKMQPGLKWEDGAPLTTADIIFGHEVGCDRGSGAISFLICDSIEAVDALDDTTWTVTYRPGRTDSLYFTNFNGQNLILPKHELGDTPPHRLPSDPRVAEHPMGWGPYQIGEGGWIKGSRIEAVNNPHYAGAAHGLPRIPLLTFEVIPDSTQLWNALYAGELDLVTSDGLQADLAPAIEEAEQVGKIRAYFLASATWEHLDFNFNRPDDLSQPSLLADPLIRHAIAYGADRQGYVEAVYSGRASVMHSFIPPVSWAYPGDKALTIYPYDAARASRLLDEAGYLDEDGDGVREKNGEPLSFSYRTSTGGAMREKLAQLFQRDMAAIGIEITLDFLPASVWFGTESGLARRDFELGEFAWTGEADPSGATLYSCDQISTPENGWEGQNVMGWCNEVASEALARATTALSLEERRQAYALAQQEFTKDLPSLPLFNRLEIYASLPHLQNFNPNPSEYATWNIADWTLAAR